ncbi:MAG TPA: hypothetical protein VH575_18345 [Gemmataceae bacterium]
MRRQSFALLVLLLGGSRPVLAAEEPRTLIERAIKTMGGAEALQQKLAIHTKMKIKPHYNGTNDSLSMEGEAWEVGGRSKLLARIDRLVMTVVVNGDKSWANVNGQVHDFGKDEIAEQQISKYVDQVTALAPLLADKGFTLAPLAGIKVNSRPAAGLKVSCKGQPDISLYFDNETSLLIKYAYRAKRSGEKKEVLHETILSDYREPDLASADEKVLHAAKMDVTGPALLEFVRKQTPSKKALERVRLLIGKLGDEAFRVREQASKDLVAAGPVAIPLLREATKNKDAEVVRRARECLRQLGEQSGKAPVSAAVRLLALRRPEGAAETLLNYLPAADADVANEVRAALFTLAHADGKPDPVLVEALRDKDQRRRAAAAAALGEDGGSYARQPGRRVIPRPFKIARKRVSYVDGKLDVEIETTEQQFFNAFEDKLFAKP